MLQHKSIDDIKLANTNHGHFFFSRGAMKFFNSRVLSATFAGSDGWYFVTSERYDEKSPRLYTVRRLNDADRQVDTIGDFQRYMRASTAIRAAQKFAQGSL